MLAQPATAQVATQVAPTQHIATSPPRCPNLRNDLSLLVLTSTIRHLLILINFNSYILFLCNSVIKGIKFAILGFSRSSDSQPT